MSNATTITPDIETAQAFASSWNTLPQGTVYTREQFEDWMAPLNSSHIAGKSVLELGCGNGSLLWHMAAWSPAYLEGVDLGDSVIAARRNMQDLTTTNWRVVQGDITQYTGELFDLVYCIGVLHHLKDPQAGFEAVVRQVKPGGAFHCWVYGREGNDLVVYLVDPIRRVASKLPWWVNKYFFALPLSLPFWIYAKIVALLPPGLTKFLPLASYMRWIAKREFRFFWHVAFDQLVTPQTVYLPKSTLQSWLSKNQRIDQESCYLIQRNGNSWKFGGKVIAK